MPKGKIVADLSRFSSKEMLAKWLWTELCSYRLKKGILYSLNIEMRMPFESPVYAFVYVYRECIPIERQTMFREAIGDVLLGWGNNENAPIGAIEDIVYLIMAIEAPEPLSAFLPTVGNGSLGRRHPDILFSVMTCLRSLSPSLAAHETTLGLIASENFDDGYLFEAIKILTKCDPSQVAPVIEELRPRLIKLGERVRASGDKGEEEEFSRAARECGLEFLSLS